MASITFNHDPKESLDGHFLTPVYFDNEVLVKHLYSKTIAVSFASETYGTINWSDGCMSFGINSKGAIFAWLGDLEQLTVAEQHHWKEHNLLAQNDTKSEFFDAQINAQFSEPTVGIQAINALEDWNAAFALKHGTELYKPKAFTDRIEVVRRYRRVIINSEDDFIRFVSELNEIINENVDNAKIRKFLTSNNLTPDAGSKGNKLLEMTYRDVLGDTKNLIAPFFWLYDLRLWADHDMGDGKLVDVAAQLGIADLKDFEAIFTKLLERLRDAFTELKAAYG
ncbi:hypothetical protein [uncultured Maritalea sp.]|jgi:hypothetical protein|uniref:hypothetical protein n=1 Tax=uncultured Maritalea sp. TaxID=757249 RepID=UPI00261502BA|nr:hypothetical protein [uncultured Maritalea sp.]